MVLRTALVWKIVLFYLIADLVANGADRLIRVENPRYEINILRSGTQVSVWVSSKVWRCGQRRHHPVVQKLLDFIYLRHNTLNYIDIGQTG